VVLSLGWGAGEAYPGLLRQGQASANLDSLEYAGDYWTGGVPLALDIILYPPMVVKTTLSVVISTARGEVAAAQPHLHQV